MWKVTHYQVDDQEGVQTAADEAELIPLVRRLVLEEHWTLDSFSTQDGWILVNADDPESARLAEAYIIQKIE